MIGYSQRVGVAPSLCLKLEIYLSSSKGTH